MENSGRWRVKIRADYNAFLTVGSNATYDLHGAPDGSIRQAADDSCRQEQPPGLPSVCFERADSQTRWSDTGCLLELLYQGHWNVDYFATALSIRV